MNTHTDRLRDLVAGYCAEQRQTARLMTVISIAAVAVLAVIGILALA
jgi:hypothetical protein